MSKFPQTSGFKWIDPKEDSDLNRDPMDRDLIESNLNKYTSNASKGCVLEVDLEYPKELQKLHSD